SNEGCCSWYDFALAVVEMAGLRCGILPVTTNQYPTKAFRPPYSVLDKASIKTDFNINIPHWKESLQRCIELLIKL
ncbi:MAG: sugar nucleotide-binding protein, partial [Bacteroidales bacterium]|nr:sugar nucleotide-binding protein [Bacteroidales bacterium]